MFGTLRAIYRLVLFPLLIFLVLGYYVLTAPLFGMNLKRILPIRKNWAKMATWFLGIQIEVKGNLPTEPSLLVYNHRSYIDLFAAFQHIEAIPVGKAEVSKWPVIGLAGKMTGAIFVDRGNKNSRKATRDAIAQTLKEGHHVIIYPEGTSHIEAQTIDFKIGSFEVAAAEGFPVVPVAVDYEYLKEAAFVDDDEFLGHFLKCFRRRKIPIRFSYGEPLQSGDAQWLMQTAKSWIDHSLKEMEQMIQQKGIKW
ncbi:MAG: lysophospholipid acyltransferase family protein [Chitinophagales bacterium]